MGSYFNFLIRKTGAKKLKKKKKSVKKPIKDIQEELKTKDQLKPVKPDPKLYSPSSYGSSSSIAGAAMAAVVGLIGIVIFSQVYSALNTSAFSPATENMINLIPLVLVGAVIVGIIGALTMVTRI